MRIQDLRYVLAVVEEANLTRASERMNISVSAMSEAIRRVEAAVGRTLFTRSNRGMELTVEGELVLPHVKGVINAAAGLDRFRDATSRGSARLPLRVGTLFGYGTTVLQRLIDHPPLLPDGSELMIKVGVTDWHDASGGLASGVADLAVVPGPLAIDGELVRVPLCEVPRVVLFSARHRLAGEPALTLEQVDEIGWIRPDVGQVDRTWASFMFAECERGGPPKVGQTGVRTPQEASLAVHNGEGALVAIPELVELFLFGDVVAKPVADLGPVPIHACYRATSACPALRVVIQLLQAGLPPKNGEPAIMGYRSAAQRAQVRSMTTKMNPRLPLMTMAASAVMATDGNVDTAVNAEDRS